MTIVRYGPGTLTIGQTGTEIDVSCYVNGFKITTTKDQGDSTTHLCGDVTPGPITYTHEFDGNIDVDVDKGAASLFALSWEHKGEEADFTFTPNTADGTSATGVCILDPLDFGSDEYGNPLNSDVKFSIVGEPEFTYGTGAAVFAEGEQAREPVGV